MVGGWEKSSAALCLRAAATLPERWACRPASSGKASKIPKVDGPSRIANHDVVAGSCCTMERPPRRKLSTSASFPGFASSRTSSATLTVSAIYHLLRKLDCRTIFLALYASNTKPRSRRDDNRMMRNGVLRLAGLGEEDRL